MSGDRYEISEGELDVLAITGPEGTRYIDGAEIEARVIRQQARDIDELRTELTDMTQQRDAWRRRAEESEPHLATGDKSREIAANPGVQGLAQLGRNALARVTELEAENAYLRAANSDGASLLATVTEERELFRQIIAEQREHLDRIAGELAAAVAERDRLRNDLADALDVRSGMRSAPTALAAVMAERDALRARLAAIDAAPTVAYVDGNNLYLECQLQFPAFNYQHQFTNVELIARPEAK